MLAKYCSSILNSPLSFSSLCNNFCLLPRVFLSSIHCHFILSKSYCLENDCSSNSNLEDVLVFW